MKSAKPVGLPLWRFRGSKDSLNKIWMNSSSAVIFFDGASKGNLGASRAGGLVLSPDGLTKFSFSWGLGSLSNNQAKSYSLLMATQISKEKGYKSVQIFGNSKMLIKVLNSVDNFNNSVLNIILKRIRIILKEFEMVESFHILQDLNSIADALANKVCLLPQGFLSINGAASYFHSIL